MDNNYDTAYVTNYTASNLNVFYNILFIFLSPPIAFSLFMKSIKTETDYKTNR